MPSIQELRQEANKVIHETQTGGNSALRIGNLYNGIIDFLGILDDRTVDPYYYDDTALKEAIRRVDNAIALLDEELEAALQLANQERQRLDALINSIDGEIQDKMETMLSDAEWLEQHAQGIQEAVNEGEIYWKSEWNQNIEQYLQEVGVWARNGDIVKTQWTAITQDVASIQTTVAEVQQDLSGRPTSTQWTQITQKVNGIEQTVNALLYQGDITEALQSSINQSIDNKVARLNLETTYAKIDTEGSKEIIEWMYSALRNETTAEKTFNDLVSAGKSGLLNGISNVHTYVEVVRNGEVLEYVAGSAIEAKVNDAVTGLYNRATPGDASTTIFSQVKKDTEDIATIVTHATDDYTSASIATKFDNWKAGLVIKTDLDSATASLVATMDEKDNASALVLEQKIDQSSADLLTRMGDAVSAVNLWTTLGNAYGQLVTVTNYSASGIASSASVNQAKADMFAEIADKTSAVYLKTTLDDAYGELITKTNYSSAGIASTASVEQAKVEMSTALGDATSAVNLISTIEGSIGELITKTNYSSAGIASSASVDQAKADLHAEITNATAAANLQATLEGAIGTLITSTNLATSTAQAGFITSTGADAKINAATKDFLKEDDVDEIVADATAGLMATNDFTSAAVVAKVNSAGSSVLVKADQINFKTGTFSIKNGSTTTFSVDSSGNVSLKGSITATDGTFNGLVYANKGLCLPVSRSSAKNDHSMTGTAAVHINEYSPGYAQNEAATVYLPDTPNTGQQILVVFAGQVKHKYMYINNSRVEFLGEFDPGTATYADALHVSVTVIYDGTTWHVINYSCDNMVYQ